MAQHTVLGLYYCSKCGPTDCFQLYAKSNIDDIDIVLIYFSLWVTKITQHLKPPAALPEVLSFVSYTQMAHNCLEPQIQRISASFWPPQALDWHVHAHTQIYKGFKRILLKIHLHFYLGNFWD